MTEAMGELEAHQNRFRLNDVHARGVAHTSLCERGTLRADGGK